MILTQLLQLDETDRFVELVDWMQQASKIDNFQECVAFLGVPAIVIFQTVKQALASHVNAS